MHLFQAKDIVGRRRKLVRKKSAGSDSIALLITGLIVAAGAVLWGLWKILRALWLFASRALAERTAAKAAERVRNDPLANAALKLLGDVDTLVSFSDVRQWDNQASDVVASLLAQQNSSNYEELADQLQQYIDLTPESKSERKELLAELRAEKKQLQLEKRELNASMRAIRTDARQRSSGTPYSLTGLMGMTALQRQRIRFQKEQDLAPLEDQKAWFDSQIDQLDRRILWAQRFADDEEDI
jgi:hypothetical protein